MLDLDRITEPDVAPVLESAHHLVAVSGSDLAPVEIGVEVGSREQHVVDLRPLWRQGRVGVGRVGDQDARVGHQPLLVDELTEHLVPAATEVDVVVSGLGVRRGRPRQEQEARRRVAEPADRPRLAVEQLAVGHGEIGIEHDDVGSDALALGREDGGGT